MLIIVRKVPGGYLAKLISSNSTFLGDLGRTYAEAVGKLVIASQARFGLSVGWDMQDEWTQGHCSGKTNRRPSAEITIAFDKLPQVSTPEEARQLRIAALGLPSLLLKPLRYALNGFSGPFDATLGYLCSHTVAELRAKQARYYRFGKKRLALLRELLRHYGLSFRGG